MTPNLEQQEAWFAEQFGALGVELDIEVDYMLGSSPQLSTVIIACPDAVSDIVQDRLLAIVEEGNRQFQS